MSKSIFELTDDWQAVADMLDEGADEQAVSDTLEAIEGEIDAKADGYASLIRAYKAKASALSDEIKRLSERKAAFESNARRLTENLEMNMRKIGKDRIKTAENTIYIGKNPKTLRIADEQKTLETIASKYPEFLRLKTEINKKDLLKGIESGEVALDGVEIVQTESLRIR